MYREDRTYASTPGVWAGGFVGAIRVGGSELDRLWLRLDPRWHAISRRLGPGDSVLDAGCGLGAWPVFLAEHGMKLCGLDFSEQMIELLRQRCPGIEWLPGPIQQMPLADGRFDGVISWGVIEHDEAGPEAGLREIHRVLKPGGLAFLTVPIDSEAHRRTSRASFAVEGARTFFQYFYTPQEFAELLERTGFVLEEPIRPCGRHYSLAFPGVYVRAVHWPALLQRMLGFSLKPLLALMPSTSNMQLAVARKPT